MTLKTATSTLTLLLVLATMLIVQMHLKVMPAIILASFTSLTIFAFIFKQDKLSAILLSVIILLSSSFFWFLSSNKIKDAIFPFKQVPGHFVMDTSFIYCIPIGIILGLLTTFLYFQKNDRHKKFELYSLTIYLVATVIIIFRHILF